MGLNDDFGESLHYEELKSSFGRVKIGFLQGLADIGAPGFRRVEHPQDRVLPSEAEERGLDPKGISELAKQRAIEAERERGLPETDLVTLSQVLDQWRANMAERIAEERRARLGRDDG